MSKNDLFTIGEVSKICKIPVPTLRYYDEEGILKAEKVDRESGYRYYSWDSIFSLSLLRTFKHFDFTLNQSHIMIDKMDLDSLQKSFQEKLEDYKLKLKQIAIEYDSLKAWNDLINEAQYVWSLNEIPIELVDIPENQMIVCHPQNYNSNSFKNVIVCIDLVNSISGKNANTLMHATGALTIDYPNREKRLQNQIDPCTIYIEPHPECVGNWVSFGGFPAIITYHRGVYGTIQQTYELVYQWVRDHECVLEENVIEQYILDYWSSLNEEQFITKLIFPIKRS